MRAGTDPMVVMLQNHQLLAPLTHADQQPSLSALNPHEISPLRGWVRGRTLSAGEEGGKLEAGHCVRVEELWFIEVGGHSGGTASAQRAAFFCVKAPKTHIFVAPHLVSCGDLQHFRAAGNLPKPMTCTSTESSNRR